jgi:hypothetical protein
VIVGGQAFLSAIRAGQLRMDAASANVAGQSTGAGAPFDVHLAAAPAQGGVEAQVVVDPGRESGLARETVDLLRAARDTQTAIRAARRSADAVDSVLDILA